MVKVPLKDIIVWKHRNIPKRRGIPRHLKLAILSRANMVVPTTNILWMVNRLRQQGVTWPNRLQRELEDFLPEVRVTVELFQNQKPPMSDDIIGNLVGLYIRANRVPYFPGCTLIYFPFEHTDRSWLENELNYDMGTLFKKPRVRMDKNEPRRYWLLVYACLPTKLLNQYIKPESFPPPPKPKTPMPPIHAITSASAQRGIRIDPSTDNPILGAMIGDEVLLNVQTKKRNGKHIWYEAILLQDMKHSRGKLVKGSQFWMAGGEYSENGGIPGIIPDVANYSVKGFGRQTVTWDFFRFQLIEFEKNNPTLSRDERITKLRQMSHNRSTPFDHAMGVPHGSGKLYLNERENVDTEWQVFLDYDSVRMPDAQIVDMHHLIVGLDALKRPDEPRYFNNRTYYGKRWSAATWAGDVGSAVSDMQFKDVALWEKNNKNASFQTRLEYYFSSRASVSDLLADIDAWGLNQLRGTENSIDKLFASYYSHTLQINGTLVISARKIALENFLRYYNFHYNAKSDYSPLLDFLFKQSDSRKKMEHHISVFAHIWNIRNNRKNRTVDKNISQEMTRQFLAWLEGQAIINVVET